MNRIKTLVITGSGDGLGREIAIKASHDYKIICLSKSDNVFDTYDLIKVNSPDSCAIKVDICDLNETAKKIQSLKLNIPQIVYIYSKSSAESFLNLSKYYDLNDYWMNTNLMCMSEKTSSVLNKIKWKKIFLFSPGEEEYLLYKI